MCACAAFRRIVSKSCSEIRMLNCLFFRIFPPFVLSGCGLLPANSIWQGAGGPATSQMRCWLLPNGRIFPASAGILCVGSAYCTCIFLRCPHVGATWAFSAAPHTHSLSGQKAAHSGDTRLTVRCRRSAHPQGRSCRLFSRAENRHDRHV